MQTTNFETTIASEYIRIGGRLYFMVLRGRLWQAPFTIEVIGKRQSATHGQVNTVIKSVKVTDYDKATFAFTSMAQRYSLWQ